MRRFTGQDECRLWDVAIIGAGMGGGFAARALADAGHDVLLIDRGNEEPSAPRLNSNTNDFESLLTEGKWPTISAFEVDERVRRWFGAMGAGIGGSTNLYSAALERFERHDLDSLPETPHPTGGWPIRYDELLPYYEKAERMLHVAGTRDPLSSDRPSHLEDPPPLGPSDTEFVRSFVKSGMHPYRLHVGIRYRPGCDECLGQLCHNNCRADARSVLAEGRLTPTILERAEAVRLEASSDTVSHAILLQGGNRITVRAKIFVLAAGAIHTPKLLLESCGEHWPDGLANYSGMVGRNLMFHAVQRFVMWPGKRLPSSGPRKSIGFRDFYRVDDERLASVQSTGLELGYGEILVRFYEMFDQSAVSWLRMLRPLLRIPAALIAFLFGSGTIFACNIEDLPYPDNRVLIDRNEADGIRIRYRIEDELRDRLARFRGLIKNRLDMRRTFFLSDGVQLNYGHPCGTCVMGNDPATSVVNRDCRAHGIANLFIADASFMPTSGATNPGLTIAANALRVSDAVNRLLLNWSRSRIPAGYAGITETNQAASSGTISG